MYSNIKMHSDFEFIETNATLLFAVGSLFWGYIKLEVLVLCFWFHDFLVNWSPKAAKITSAKFHRSWMRLSEKIKI